MASTTVDAGATLDVNDVSMTVNSLLGAGNVTLGANAATNLTLNSGNFTGNISGAGNLIKATAGTLALNTNAGNTYTGNTNINDGLVTIAGGTFNIFGTAGILTIGDGVGAAGSATVQNLQSGMIDSNQAVVINGDGLYDLNGFTETIGSLAGVAGSQVTLGSGTLTTGSNNTSTTYTGSITGTTGGVTKTGTGTWLLNGAGSNTFTGNFTVNDGTVQLDMSGAAATGQGALIIGDNVGAAGSAVVRLLQGAEINNTSAVTINSDGRLDLNNFNESVGSVAGTGLVTMGTGILTTGGDNTNTAFSGVISGTGVGTTLTKQGTGTWTVTGTNTYTGSTAVSGGTLLVNSSTVAGNSPLGFGDNTAPNGTVANVGGIVQLAAGVNITTEFLTLNGGQLLGTAGGAASWTGTIQLGANSQIDALGGTLNLGNIIKTDFNLTLTDSLNSAPGVAIINLNGVISGDAVGFNDDLIVTGVTTNLNAANTYLGPTFITSTNVGGGNGILNANVANALPIAAGRTSVTMDVGGTGSSVLNIGGIPAFPLGANQSIASLAGITSSRVTLGNNTLTIGFGSGLNTNGTAGATFAGVISGTSPGFAIIKDDTSTQILTGINTYIGFTAVNGGTLQVGDGATPFSQLGTGLVFVNPTGTLDIRLANGGIFANTVNTAGVSTVVGTNTAGNTQRITGAINGTANFLQNAGGTSVFENVNTYQGGTRITNASTIIIGTLTAGATAGQNISTNTIVVDGGSTLQLVNVSGGVLNNDIRNNVAGTGLVLSTSTFATTLTGALTDAGGGTTLALTQNGSGTTTLVNAGNTYTGATTVLQGTLQVGTAGLVGSVGSQAPATGIVVGTGGTLTIVNTTGNALANNITNGVGGAGTVIVNSALTNTLSGALTDGGAGTLALTQSGTGTTILTNAGNTYTGATTISGGTLQIGTAAFAGSIGATAVNLGTGGTLNVVRPTGNAINNNIQNNLGGAGLVINNTNGALAGTTFSGNIIDGVGTLAFTQAGTAASFLTGTNTYSGVTNVTAGTLFAGSSTALGSAANGTVVAAGATLDLFGQNIAAEAVQIQGTGDAAGLGFAFPQIAALANSSFTAATLGGPVTLAASANIGSNFGGITLTNTVSGGAGAVLTKVGTDTLTLNGVNNYNDATLINAGIVIAGNASALGSIGAGTTVANGAALSIANGINVGLEPLTINGAGAGAAAPGALTQALGGTSSFSGPITLASNSTINANGGTLTLTNTATINKTGLNLTLAGVGGAGSSITVNGVISGNNGALNSDLSVNGTTANLNAANTYLGQTFITSIVAGDGIVNANIASALPTSPVRTQLIMDAAAAGNAAAAAGAGASVLNVNTSQSVASLTSAAGTGSVINLGANTLTIGFGTVNNTAGYVNSTFAGVINGANAAGVSIVKDETSTQIFSGLNTYTGATNVTGGTLQAGIATQAFGLNSAVTVGAAGTLDLAGFSNTIGSLAGAAGAIVQSTGGVATLTTGALNTNTDYAGVLQNGAGGQLLLVKNGTGIQTLSGAVANTYTGLTTVNAGELDLNKTAGVTAVGGNLTIGDGAGGANADIVKLLASNQIIDSSLVLIHGSSGSLDLNNFSETIAGFADTGAVAVNGSSVALGSGTLTFGADNVNRTFSGAITGVNGNLIKNGTGVQLLSGTTTANTFSGTTTVNAGGLQLNKNDGVQAIGGHITIGDGAGGANSDFVQLLASNQIIDTSRISINGSSGRLDINGFTETIAWFADTGVVAVNGSSVALGAGGTLNYGNASNQTFSGAITGTGFINKNGTGTQTLAGTTTANTFSGLTTVNSGQIDLNKTAGTLAIGGNLTIGDGVGGANSDIVRLLQSNQIADTSVVQLNASTGRLDLNGFSETVGSVASTGAFTLGGSTINLGGGTLTTGGLNTSTTYSGVIGGAGGNLTKEGTGTFTLSGLNTYTGATAVNGGRLLAQSTQAFGVNSATTVNANSILDIGGFDNSIGSLAGGGAASFVQSNGGAATLTTGGNNTSTLYSGVIRNGTGLLSLTKVGIGTQTLSGANTFTGPVNVNAGTLSLQNGAAIEDTVSVTVTAPGTLNLLNNETIGSLAGTGSATLNARTLTTGGNGTSTAFSGVLSGAGGALVKNGQGTFTVSGTNTYTGGTTLNAGTLAAGSTKAFGSGNLTMNGGTIRTSGGPLIVDIGGGNVQFNGGIYVANVGGTTPGITHDQLRTTGTANTLGGTLALVQQNGYLLAPGDKVNLAVATGGVAGGSVNGTPVPNANVTGLAAFSNTPLLVPRVNAYLTTVTLEAMQGSFKALAGQLGMTPNQIAVAGALDSVAAKNLFKTGVVKELDFLDVQSLATLKNNLDKIAPEELTSIFHLGVSLSNIYANNLDRRMEDIRIQAGGGGGIASGPADGGTRFVGGAPGPRGVRSKEIAPPSNDQWGMFLTGSGEFTRVGSTTNASGYNFTTGGVTAGLDYRVNGNFAVGLSLGYANTTASLANGGSLDVDGGRLGLYATYFEENFHMDASVTGGLNSYRTRRVTPNNTIATASPNGAEINVKIGAGYDWKFGGLTVGPVISYQYTNMQLDGFTEAGAFAPLTVAGRSEESSRTSLGVRAYYDGHIGSKVFRPEVRLAWQHEFGATGYSLTSSFATLGGSPFIVSGTTIGRDSLLASAGFVIMWNDRLSTFVYYDGQFGSQNFDSHNVSAGMRLQF